MPRTLEHLQPYTSLTLARIRFRLSSENLLVQIPDEIQGVLQARGRNAKRTILRRAGPVSDDGIVVGYIHYLEERTARWSGDESIKDSLNQLVLVCLRRRHIAILATDPGRSRAIAQRLGGDSNTGLSALQPIESGVLNATFARGAAPSAHADAAGSRLTVEADEVCLNLDP